MGFVVIEGLDGSGKSTQVKMLRSLITSRNIPYEYLHFPVFESPYFGELIARFLRGDLGSIAQVDPYLVAMLYAGDRFNAKQTMEQWIRSGMLVLADRYVYSNIGFQCAKVSGAVEVEKLYRWIFDLEYDYFKIPKPDLSIFLDVPMDFVIEKLSEQRESDDRGYLLGKADIHEADIGFQRKVRDTYLFAVENDPAFEIIECTGSDGAMLPPQQIFDKIVSLINRYNIIPDGNVL